MLASTTALALATASPAHADPGCQNGGAYILWARGSGQAIGDVEAQRFQWNVETSLNAAGIGTHAWAELGNLDGSVQGPNQYPDDPANEYPAVGVGWAQVNGDYDNSVFIGVEELIANLNHRYTLGPVGMGCSTETAVLGGYSQGADLLGWALALTDGGSLFGHPMPALTPAARSHIGFVAGYGDPRLDAWSCPRPQWVRGSVQCQTIGVLGQRAPQPDMVGRTGSWCDQADGICNQSVPLPGTHTTAYRGNQANGSDGWIAQSAAEIANNIRTKVCTFVQCHTDLMFLHKLADNGANMYIYNQANGFGSPGLMRIFPGSSGWNWNLMKIAMGDVNNDGASDLMMLHKTGDGGANFYVFYGGAAQYADSSPVKNFPGSAGWSFDSMKMVVGDFDVDHRTDLMFLHKTGDNGANLYIYNQAGGFTGPGLVRQFPGSSGWNWNLMKLATGDVNNDGVSDLLLLHKTGDGGANFYTILGGSGQFIPGSPARQFPASAGWSWDSMKMVAGDFDGDHHADLMFMHKLADNGANLYIYNQATGFTGPGLTRAYPASAGWNWNLMKLATGDINNGVSCLLMLHKTGDGGANFYAFYGGTGQFADGSPVKNFPASGGWSFDSMLSPLN